MAYKGRDFRGVYTTLPPIEALSGGRPARKDRVLSVLNQADSLLGNGRRIVARVGIHGAEEWQVLNTNTDSPLQKYPLLSASRVVARTPPILLTPGHFLKMSALVIPSGATQKYVDEPGSWIMDTPYGRIDVVITWVGTGGVQSTIHKVTIAPSKRLYAAENTINFGGSWNELHRVEIPLMRPVFAETAANIHAWSESVEAEVTIKYVGGPRVVDLVISEVPWLYVRDADTDTTFSTTLSTAKTGKSLLTYPLDYPVVERWTDDVTLGSELLADVTDLQHRRFGPVLAHWTAFDEGTTVVTATEVPSVSTTSSSYVDMVRQSLTTWDADYPGLSISPGGHAQSFKSSNSYRELRGKDACVPVKCYAYCWVSAGGSGTLAFQTEQYSIATIPVTSTTPAWRAVTGHLRCGLGPEDTSVLQVFGKASSGTLHMSQFCVEYANR